MEIENADNRSLNYILVESPPQKHAAIKCWKGSFELAFWKTVPTLLAFASGKEERRCYFLGKKPGCVKTWCMKLYILRKVSGSAFNLLNKSCHISHKTLLASCVRLVLQKLTLTQRFM